MSKFHFTVIAAAFVGAAAAITKALENGEDPIPQAALPAAADKAAPAAAEPAEPAKRSPGKGAAKPAAETTKPPAGKTYDELRSLIKPLVEAGQGEDVKKVIAKYAPTGGTLKDLTDLPQHHAAFEKDISALTY